MIVVDNRVMLEGDDVLVTGDHPKSGEFCVTFRGQVLNGAVAIIFDRRMKSTELLKGIDEVLKDE